MPDLAPDLAPASITRAILAHRGPCDRRADVDPADRIAAYLADELDDAARDAFEDDLARDAALRSQLDAVHRADAALASQAPTELPDGAHERLRAALRPELDARLDRVEREADATVFTASGATDELAARRDRRSIPWTAIGGMAAAVVAVAVVAVGPLGLGGSGDDEGDLFATSADDAGDDAVMESAPADEAALAGPALIGSDRALDAAGADRLLDDPDARALTAAGLDADAATELAAAHAAAFGAAPVTPATDSEVDQAEPFDDQAEDGERSDPMMRSALRTEGEVTDELRLTAGTCLEELLAGGGAPIVVSVETVVFEGEPAFAFTLVGSEPAGPATRPEVWVLAREDCSVRYFTQG